MGIQIPNGANKILQALENHGYEAYVVGGCVRDSILGRTPKDWDTCTSALPEKVIALAGAYGIKVIPTGLKHGTVTLVMDDSYEVTTFRSESEYSDGRHPDKVEFVPDLEQDLMRRDFTINAMAYNEEKGLIDYFGGMNDLKNHIIKCVGNPYERFEEDHLRMLRALRFAARYDFEIDPYTEFALRDRFYKINSVSKERINSELCSILMSTGATKIMESYATEFMYIVPEFRSCVGFEQNNKYHSYDVLTHIMKAFWYCQYRKGNSDIITLLAVLFHDIGKPDCYSEDENGGHFYGHAEKGAAIARSALIRLRFTNEIVDGVVELIHNHDRELQPTKKSVRRLVNKIGVSQSLRLFDVMEADIYGHAEWCRASSFKRLAECKEIFTKLVCENECMSLRSLNINGKDVMSLGVPEGKLVGEILNKLLSMVMDEEINNDYDTLIEKAKELIPG